MEEKSLQRADTPFQKMQLSIIAVVVLTTLACTVIATKLHPGQDGSISNRTTRRINVVYPEKGYFYMLGSGSNKVVVCIALDEYKTGRYSDGTTFGTYTSCHYGDSAFQFQLVGMLEPTGGGSPGSGLEGPSECVMIRNRYSGTCLTIANNYNEGSGTGGEIAGAPVYTSGCGAKNINYGKSRFQAWKITGLNPPWIETCSISPKKYLTRAVGDVQKSANLVLKPWEGYGTQGWVVYEPTGTDVDANMPKQYGCGASGECWAGGEKSACGAGKWCYTSLRTPKCRSANDCIAHSTNPCVYGYMKCDPF